MDMALVNLCPGVWTLDEMLRLPGGLRFPTRGALFALADGPGASARWPGTCGGWVGVGDHRALPRAPPRARGGARAFPGARVFGPPGLAGRSRPGAGRTAARRTRSALGRHGGDGPGRGDAAARGVGLLSLAVRNFWLTDMAFNIPGPASTCQTALPPSERGARPLRPSGIARWMVKDPRALRRTVDRLVELRPPGCSRRTGIRWRRRRPGRWPEGSPNLPAC